MPIFGPTNWPRPGVASGNETRLNPFLNLVTVHIHEQPNCTPTEKIRRGQKPIGKRGKTVVEPMSKTSAKRRKEGHAG